LFEDDALLEMQEEFTIPPDILSLRPVLQLAVKREPKLRPALLAERRFWQELDRLRIRIYRAALRPYVLAIGRERIPQDAPLREQHGARVVIAGKTLSQKPIADYGVKRLIEEARVATAAFAQTELLQWLPNVQPYFTYLEA
jgi:hypothetical protein